MTSKRISDNLPPQIKILNTVIPLIIAAENNKLSDVFCCDCWKVSSSTGFYVAAWCVFFQTMYNEVLIDLSLTVKAATLIFISGHGLAILSAKDRNSGFIYNLVKTQ